VNSRQYFGDPIDCTQDPTTANVIDNFCWIHSYLILPKKGAPKEAFDFESDKELPHYGIRRKNKMWTEDVYQKYYQWVGFVLFIQAAFFFVPRFLWKYYWEAGRVKSLVSGLTASFLEEKDYKGKTRLILNYLKQNTKQNQVYVLSFFFCEALNFVNVVCQIFVTDWFLGYTFSTLGFDVLRKAETIPGLRDDVLNLAFPKLAACTFRRGGDNLNVQEFHSICVLPVNTFNEKIYIVLWFWFIALAVVTGLHLLYTVLLIFIPKIRSMELQRRFRLINENPWDEPTLAQLEKKIEGEGRPMTESEIMQIITTKLSIGDWFMLQQLGQNMDPLIFGKMLNEYALLLKGERSRKSEQPISAAHRNSGFDAAKRGSFMGVGIGGASAPLIK
jgi:hypothetical protein